MRRALVVDKDVPTRAWFGGLLTETFPLIRIIAADDVIEASRCLQTLVAAGAWPDVALIGLDRADDGATAIIRRLRKTAPDCLCIGMSNSTRPATVFDALRAGAQGYLLKSQPRQELLRHLEGLTRGEPALCPRIAALVIASFEKADEAASVPLTSREREVLGLIARGYTLNRVAEALGLSPYTIGGYAKAIYRKLEVSSRAEATREALRLGL